VSTLCKNCSNRIYLGNYLDKPAWVHHGSNFIPCYGGLDTVAEPAEPTSGDPPQSADKWAGIEKLADKLNLQSDERVAELRKALEPLLEKVEFACTLNFTDHDRKLLKEELDRWRES